MTDSPDEYGELLRRALSAEANSVVPSPDGLEIIRGRIERRGLRWLVWWRAGASVAGAVLVAATVVMVVPQFREQVIPRVSTEGVKYAESTPPVDGSATSRPRLPTRSRRPTTPRSRPSAGRVPAPPCSRRRPPRPGARGPARGRPPGRTRRRRLPGRHRRRRPPAPPPRQPHPRARRDHQEVRGDRGDTDADEDKDETPASSESPCSPDECAPSGDVSPPVPTEAGTPFQPPSRTSAATGHGEP